jgi:calpain-15
VSLLEKAWAKLHGSYARVEGGIPYFAYSQLCGLPGSGRSHDELTNPDKVNRFWFVLKACDRRNFILLASTHGEGENRNNKGIISGHCYSIIQVIEFEYEG